MAFLDELEAALEQLHQVVKAHGSDDGFDGFDVLVRDGAITLALDGSLQHEARKVFKDSAGRVTGKSASDLIPLVKQIIVARIHSLAHAEDEERKRVERHSRTADRYSESRAQIRRLVPSPLETLAQEGK
jgi:hypothetical protein